MYGPRVEKLGRNLLTANAAEIPPSLQRTIVDLQAQDWTLTDELQHQQAH